MLCTRDARLNSCARKETIQKDKASKNSFFIPMLGNKETVYVDASLMREYVIPTHEGSIPDYPLFIPVCQDKELYDEGNRTMQKDNRLNSLYPMLCYGDNLRYFGK